jgi:cysteine desulfurase
LDAASQLEKEGFEAKYIEVNGETIADPSKIHAEINDQTSLVSIIHANNETGSINDLKKISGLLDGKQIFLHTDAVQSFGKISTDVKKLGIDSLSISGHKIGAPKGIGAVFVKGGTPLSPILFGGSQERNRRGGTENIPGIIGLAEAVKIARSEMDDNFLYIKNLRDHFTKGIKQISSDMLSINGSNNGIPHIVSLTFAAEYFNIDPEAMLMYLDINGIAASNGAACTSGTLKPSHVILASGKSIEYANGTIRFSLGVQNNSEEIDYTLEVIEKMVKKFRK